jgi:type IV secretion system protein VirB11
MTACASTAADAPVSALRHNLGPLVRWLDADNVESIDIARPRWVLVRLRDGTREQHYIEQLDAGRLEAIASQIAFHCQRVVRDEKPRTSGWLPNGDRVEITSKGGVIEGHFSLSIRRRHYTALSLENLAHAGVFEGARLTRVQRASNRELPPGATAAIAAGDAFRLVRAYFDDYRNIVVAGASGSGKTTFMNALLLSVPETEVVVSIEDVQEIQLTQVRAWHAFVCSTFGEAQSQFTAGEHLASALRVGPDRILLGELRATEGWAFMQAINAGAAGCLTSLHAHDSESAIARLADLALESAPRGVSQDALKAHAREFVDCWITMVGKGGTRRVAEVGYA